MGAGSGSEGSGGGGSAGAGGGGGSSHPMAATTRPLLRHLDLSHVAKAIDTDVCALLAHLPGLTRLSLSFCSLLSDRALDALPGPLERLETLGCERMSYGRLEQLGRCLGREGGPSGEPRLLSDDSAVLACVGCSDTQDAAASLFAMLAAYRQEERRWE